MTVLRMSEEDYAKRLKRPRTRVETPPPSPGHLKYKNRPVGGYASNKEAHRAQELKLMQQAGAIRNLREQVPFELIPRQVIDGKTAERACSYFLDFQYERWTSSLQWQPVYEDVKGIRTKDYIMKRKMMLFFHGIKITEI